MSEKGLGGERRIGEVPARSRCCGSCLRTQCECAWSKHERVGDEKQELKAPLNEHGLRLV